MTTATTGEQIRRIYKAWWRDATKAQDLERLGALCPQGHWFNGPVESLTLPQQSHGRDDASGLQRGGNPPAVAERAGGRAAVAGAGAGHGHEDGRAEGQAGLPDHGPSGGRSRAAAS
jgi:hypothetical protein